MKKIIALLFVLFLFSHTLAATKISAKNTCSAQNSQITTLRAEIEKLKKENAKLIEINKKIKENISNQTESNQMQIVVPDSETQNITQKNIAPETNTYKPTTIKTTNKTYYVGPRGGCYYINGNGNKTYVDRSMCN